MKELWLQAQKVLNEMNCTVMKLTCKDVNLGYQLKNHSRFNICVNDFVLHVKAYIWKCKLVNLDPSYNKLKEYIGSRKTLESHLVPFYELM